MAPLAGARQGSPETALLARWRRSTPAAPLLPATNPMSGYVYLAPAILLHSHHAHNRIRNPIQRHSRRVGASPSFRDWPDRPHLYEFRIANHCRT